MLLKSNVFRLVLSFCLILCISIMAFADTIRLKDGSVIKGRIVGFRDGQFVVQIGDGTRSRQMTFFADEIDAIEFDSSAPTNNIVRNTNASAPNIVLPRPTPSATPVANTSDEGRIIVGNNDVNRTTNPQTVSPSTNSANNSTNASTPTNRPANTTTNSAPTSNPNTQSTSSRPKPIQLNLKVLADNTANGWTNAGWVVKKGQKIKITGTGRISLGKGNYSTPSGISSLTDKDKLMQKEATGGLLAVVGDDNNDFVFIGSSKEFTATRDGALFLGINEGLLDDNSGAFDVIIEIDPGISN